MLPAYLAAATGFVSVMKLSENEGLQAGIQSAAAFLGWSLVLAAVHIVNLLADRDTDQLNAKNLFWMDHIQERTLALTAGLLATAGLLTAGWGHLRFLLPVGGTLLLGWAYCLRPLIWSRRWGWDALANVLGYGVLAPWLGALLYLPEDGVEEGIVLNPQFPTVAVFHLVPLVFAGFLLTTLLDREGDRLAGKRTWAVRFQPGNTNILAMGVLIMAGLGIFLGFPEWSFDFRQGMSSPFNWVVGPGYSHLLAAALAGLAGVHEAARRKILIAAIFGTVLAAGGPALLTFPGLSLPLAGWMAVSYVLLLVAGLMPNK